MIHIPATTLTVGSTEEERVQLGRQYDFHPSWLADELPARQVTLKEFWVDRFPVTNRQYAAYLHATGQPAPAPLDSAMLDHPVANITAQAAAAYAGWVGKRLPTAEEWECAFQGIVAGPTPIEPSPDWVTQTRPVSDGAVSPSGLGGYGIVSEWTSVSHLPERKFLAKGPSWLHEDDWSFRPEASHLTVGPYSYVGFRCAADSEVADRHELSDALPGEWLAPAPGIPSSDEGEDDVHFHSPTGRYLAADFESPRGICYLFCPEIVNVDGRTGVNYDTSPIITWEEGEKEEKCRRAVYSVQGEYITTKYILETGPDFVDIQSIFPNESDATRQIWISTCVSPGTTFNLYDIESARTYFWFGEGDWVRARQLPHGPLARNMACHTPPIVPESPRLVAAAAVSRDGSSVFGYAKEIGGRDYMAHDYPDACCFHIEPILQVPAGETLTIRGRVYYMKGDLEALRRRIVADFFL